MKTILFKLVKDRLISYARKKDNLGKIYFHFYYGIHTQLLKLNIKEYRKIVHNVDLLMPAEHLLPLYVALNPLQETPILEIGKEVSKKYGKLFYIDVGANIGDSCLFLASRYNGEFHLIEGSDYFLTFLKVNLSQNSIKGKIEIKEVYLSNATKTVRICEEVHYGTAKISESENGRLVQFKALDDIYCDQRFRPNFIKIDVDGYDYFVVDGAKNLLTWASPIILMELVPQEFKEKGLSIKNLLKVLSECGYRNVVIYTNFGEKIFATSIEDWESIRQFASYNLEYKRFHYDIAFFSDQDADLYYTLAAQEPVP